MTLKQYIDWLSVWEEDYDKEIATVFIPCKLDLRNLRMQVLNDEVNVVFDSNF